MSIQFYNTATRSKELFDSIDSNMVSVYSCGPTVYGPIHVGNLRSFFFADILCRYLRFRGYQVMQVMNITDVDDKTIRCSQEKGILLSEYTQKYKETFFQDINRIKIHPANHYPCATDHIRQMIDMIQTLLDKEIAYMNEGSVYFNIRKFPNYGILAQLDKQNLKPLASGRLLKDEYHKEDVADFVLWKAYSSDDGPVYWDSPFGRGRPGWHIECSAMSREYLGESFDIHTGGVDNIFPHHDNEIAQSESVYNRPFVRYWMHCEFLKIQGEKISKSLGNQISLDDFLSTGYSPDLLRFVFLQSHYRSRMDFSHSLLKQSATALSRLNQWIQHLYQKRDDQSLPTDETDISKSVKLADAEFKNAMDDDLNTSVAIATLFKLLKECYQQWAFLSSSDANNVLGFLNSVNSVFECLCFNLIELDEQVRQLIEQRQLARKNGDYALSDSLRQQIRKYGILVEDTPQGMIWKLCYHE